MSSRKSHGTEPFHVIHKVPSGDGPYVQAKHAQLVEKEPEAAIVLFWMAINAGDRVDSALKDMAVVMKQLDRTEEGIEAIKSFRNRCSSRAQESLDNLLIDLYKKCNMVEEQIVLLKQKLRMISQGEVFNGKATKTARSHGKKFQVSVKQETSRILGNLGWAYMQLPNYQAAEAVYRKAQMIYPDPNKACNLALCLMRQERFDEAQSILMEALQAKSLDSAEAKSMNRVLEVLSELEESQQRLSAPQRQGMEMDDAIVQRLEMVMNEWTPFQSRRLPIFEEITSFRDGDQLAC